MSEPTNKRPTVFLAGIIQGSIKEEKIHSQDWREPIRKILDKYLPEADIYCHYSAHPNSITYDGDKIRETFDDGVEKCADSDLVIAHLPSASMGTAIEIYEAYRRGATVLTITPMAANWVVKLYSHEVFASLEEFENFMANNSLNF